MTTSLLALWLCNGRVQKRDNGLCPPFLWGESCPPALTLMPDTSFSPCMPLVPFKLLLQCWSSEGVSLSKFMCGFCKRNYLGLQKFFLQTQFPLLLQAEIMGTYFLALEPWAGQPGMGLEFLTPKISLLKFYPSQVVVGPAHTASPPLLPVWMDVVSLIL